MFYDPTCKPAKTEPSLAGLIAWLETKEPREVYKYTDSRRCMAAQYLSQAGVDPTTFIGHCGGALDDIMPGLRLISAGNYDEFEWTFGAALKRARAAAR